MSTGGGDIVCKKQGIRNEWYEFVNESIQIERLNYQELENCTSHVSRVENIS